MMANIEAKTCSCWQICKPPVANISCVWLYCYLIVIWSTQRGYLTSKSVLSVYPADLYSSSCTHTHTHTYGCMQACLIGLLSVSDQAITEAATYTTHNRQKGWTSVHQRYLNQQSQQSSSLSVTCLRAHGNQDWPLKVYRWCY